MLKHEGAHIFLDHCTSRTVAEEHHRQWNIATDLAINSYLDHLPEGCCMPGEGPFAEYPPYKSAEWYFNKLKTEGEPGKEPDEGDAEGGSDGGRIGTPHARDQASTGPLVANRPAALLAEDRAAPRAQDRPRPRSSRSSSTPRTTSISGPARAQGHGPVAGPGNALKTSPRFPPLLTEARKTTIARPSATQSTIPDIPV